jgi:mannitol-1-phosphate/altronate dehydrogenase
MSGQNKIGEIIVLGSGAIGRGFLPWIFDLKQYELIFIDTNEQIINTLNAKKSYVTYRAKNGVLEEKQVTIKQSYLLDDFSLAVCSNPVAVFMSVGPRNVTKASECLAGIKCPIILCENDPKTVDEVKAVLSYDRVYFAIPDVITSNSASEINLKKDPLAIHTEDGVLHVDERASDIVGDISFCSENELINKHWTAKLFLHNTPHCIAAYLGALSGSKYLHEAMHVPKIREIVVGSMNEMLTALKLQWEIPHDFLEWYADKEIQRFSNVLLCDPIIRVAREPLRKLELSGRLIGAAQMCLALGFIPSNILTGIVSAILFDNEDDADHYLFYLRKAVSPSILLTYILGLRKGEVLETILENRFKKIVEQLEDIVKNPIKKV